MLRKILSKVLNFNPSFIEVYDNALTLKECEVLISLFEKFPNKKEATCYIDGKVENSRFDQKKCIEFNQDLFDTNPISNIVRKGVTSCMGDYKKKYSSLEYLSPWRVFPDYNFQKYQTEDDGAKTWHTEHGGGLCSTRILAWMIYLNNAKSGTEFMHFPTMQAKAGRCIIWPAGWTHLHKGVPNKGLKYIVTGWVSYVE